MPQPDAPAEIYSWLLAECKQFGMNGKIIDLMVYVRIFVITGGKESKSQGGNIWWLKGPLRGNFSVIITLM